MPLIVPRRGRAMLPLTINTTAIRITVPPMITLSPIDSLFSVAPKITATTGLTYAYVETISIGRLRLAYIYAL